jgi:uncharacterized protein (TIGR02757 family)
VTIRGLSPVTSSKLEELYARYNRREFIHPDPLEFLHRYEDPRDREIVGLVASSLAYGRVSLINKSIAKLLEQMPSPSRFLRRSSRTTLERAFRGFKHRFTTGEEISAMLIGVKHVLADHGSLRACFRAGLPPESPTIIPALSFLVHEITASGSGRLTFLLPRPESGSACKRLHLFLRWMVRRDDVDPGGWDDVPASKLLVPLDTHMHRICRALKLTERKQADARAAIEITDAFRAVSPGDPVRYDFSLTRLGIRRDPDLSAWLSESPPLTGWPSRIKGALPL